MTTASQAFSTIPGISHSDPWAHDYICCDVDHSASTSTSLPSTPHVSQSHRQACHHSHGPIGVGSLSRRPNQSLSHQSSSAATVKPIMNYAKGRRLSYGAAQEEHGQVEAEVCSDPGCDGVIQDSCSDPGCHVPTECHDPQCDGIAECGEECSDPECEMDVDVPCNDPACDTSHDTVCRDEHCKASASPEVCHDPHCEGGEMPLDAKGTTVCADEACKVDQGKVVGLDNCQECSMEELEKWACTKEGTRVIQQYLECCTQDNCDLPVFDIPENLENSSLPTQQHEHQHNQPNVHHHLLSTLPSNNQNIIPLPNGVHLDISLPPSPQLPVNATKVDPEWTSLFSSSEDTNGLALPAVPAHSPDLQQECKAVTMQTPAVAQAPTHQHTSLGAPHNGLLPAHVCHWQNCHRVFDTMPDLLSHVAADHLGVASLFNNPGEAIQSVVQPNTGLGFTNSITSQSNPAQIESGSAGSSASSSRVVTPTESQTNKINVSGGISLTTAADFTAQSKGYAAEDMPSSALPNSTTNPFSGDPNNELLSCLWDNCFPLPQCTAETPDTCPTHAHMPHHPHAGLPNCSNSVQMDGGVSSVTSNHTHGANEQSATSNGHVHDAEHPFTPQTMLKHLLEEHLGVPGALIGWDSNTTAVNDNLPAFYQNNPSATNQLNHVHDHAHSLMINGTSSNQQSCGHNHCQTCAPHSLHLHNHSSHSHHQHSHQHPSNQIFNCGHDHKHVQQFHGDLSHHSLPTPATTQHTPSPSPSDESNKVQTCLWPGCTHFQPFTSTAELMDHISEEHLGKGKDSYTCLWDGCDREFKSRQKVLRHLQSHTGHKPYRCKICGQGFGEAAPLAAHMRRHAKERPFKCEYPGCGKTFAISSSLTIHMRTHNGEKPFVCPHCGKGFVEASNLTKHIRTHTGERPFACAFPGCNKKFSRPDQLKRHMGVHDAGRPRRGRPVKKPI